MPDKVALVTGASRGIGAATARPCPRPRVPRRRELSPTHRNAEALVAESSRSGEALPGALSGMQEVVASGPISPARPGVAEWQLDHVMVRGIPVPGSLVARAVGNATGSANDGRLEVKLPRSIQWFRVRPEGVAVYREATGQLREGCWSSTTRNRYVT
jgi:hypothetical protein